MSSAPGYGQQTKGSEDRVNSQVKSSGLFFNRQQNSTMNLQSLLESFQYAEKILKIVLKLFCMAFIVFKNPHKTKSSI
jgi:hypothetical protein